MDSLTDTIALIDWYVSDDYIIRISECYKWGYVALCNWIISDRDLWCRHKFHQAGTLLNIWNSSEIIVCESYRPIQFLCLSEPEETRVEVLYIIKGIIGDNHFLGAIIIEIHGEVHVWDTLLGIHNNIIAYVDLYLWRDRALEGNMLNINRDTSINPSRIDESIICYRNIAMILGIYHSCVTSNIESCEKIIMPYLIICYERLSV